MKKSSAFTLVELLVVVAILSILAAILFPVFASAKGSSAVKPAKVKLTAESLYSADHDDAPSTNRFIACSSLPSLPGVVGLAYYKAETVTPKVCTGSTPYRRFNQAWTKWGDSEGTQYWGDKPVWHWWTDPTPPGTPPICSATAVPAITGTPTCVE